MAAIAATSEETLTCEQTRELLDMQPHSQGGFFKETLRDTSVALSKSIFPNQWANMNMGLVVFRQSR